MNKKHLCIITIIIATFCGCKSPQISAPSAPKGIEGVWMLDTTGKCYIWNPRPTDREAVTWSGNIVNGKGSGQGIRQFSSHGKLTGRFEGILIDGIPQGKGTYSSPDGLRYIGQIKNDRMHGSGTQVWPNGTRYTGEWKNGRRTGEGILVFANGTLKQGSFKDDKLQGYGVATATNGWSYKGEFKNDAQHGRGTEIMASGVKYEGEFVEGKFCGQGVLYKPDGTLIYEGEFKNSKLHGIGTYHDTNGVKRLSKWNRGAFVKDIKSKKKHGALSKENQQKLIHIRKLADNQSKLNKLISPYKLHCGLVEDPRSQGDISLISITAIRPSGTSGVTRNVPHEPPVVTGTTTFAGLLRTFDKKKRQEIHSQFAALKAVLKQAGYVLGETNDKTSIVIWLKQPKPAASSAP